MKNLTTLLLSMFICSICFGQNIVSGKLLDKLTGDPLIGATIYHIENRTGAITDFDGNFTLINIPSGMQSFRISYLGYENMELSEDINGTTDLGNINVGASEVGLKEVEIVGSIATDRRTPVAVSTISGKDIALTTGNQEYVEVLRKTPSVYATKGGGGFGDSRINVRGFDQRNTAVLINGIPVNDMENGWVYWSNWAGLSDVTSKLQIQRGLGASKLAVPSVGGSINIITNASELERKGTLSFTTGNDAFLKGGIAYSTGLTENGLAASVQITRTQGDGYVDGTKFSAFSYFAALSKVFNDNNTLSISAVGAPQWHHQRNSASRFDNINLQTFQDLGIKYNHLWGELNGEEFTWRKNFYHKPKVFLNHYWNLSSRTDIKTSAYISIGRGGGTGPRGRINNGDEDIYFKGRIFDSFTGLGLGTHNAEGQVRFDDIVAYNQGTNFAGFGDPNEAVGTTTSSGDGFIRRASMNYHNWYGLLSTLTQKLSDNLTLTAGIDGRYYKGEHFRRLEHLLGNTNYESRSNINNESNLITDESPADFLNFYDNTYKDGTENVLAYHNDGLVGWGGVFGQVEYSANGLSVFGSLSGSNQAFKRIDYFTYDTSGDEYETDWVSHLGGTVKAGANYNFGISNVFINGGYLSRQPIFDNVFLNFSNEINEDVENQIITAVEGGYGVRTKYVDANINAYLTNWDNQTISRGIDVLVNDTLEVEGTALFTDVGQRHVGVELEAEIKPTKFVGIEAMVSIGDWKYTTDYTADVFDDNQNKIDEATIYATDLPIGDAAQTTLNIGLNLYPIKDFKIYASYFMADRLFAQFSIDEDQFLSEGGSVVQLPSYSLVDAGASYRIPFGDNGLTIFGNVNNALDTEYVSELFTNITDDSATPENEFMNNRGFYGFGRTWNAGIKLHF